MGVDPGGNGVRARVVQLGGPAPPPASVVLGQGGEGGVLGRRVGDVPGCCRSRGVARGALRLPPRFEPARIAAQAASRSMLDPGSS